MVGATLPLWIPASARMTNSVAGDNYFRTKIIELLKRASWVACRYERKTSLRATLVASFEWPLFERANVGRNAPRRQIVASLLGG